MPEETVIYEHEAIKITTARAVFGEKTYAMSTISSVELVTVQPSTGFSGLLMGGGGLFFIVSLTTLIPKDTYSHGATGPNWGLIVGSLIAAVLGFILYRSAKPTYVVKFASTSGAVEAFNSEDKTKIQPIVEAINTAIIQRG